MLYRGMYGRPLFRVRNGRMGGSALRGTLDRVCNGRTRRRGLGRMLGRASHSGRLGGVFNRVLNSGVFTGMRTGGRFGRMFGLVLDSGVFSRVLIGGGFGRMLGGAGRQRARRSRGSEFRGT